MAIHKPCGVLSHPNRSADATNSIIDAPYDAAMEAYICHNRPVYLLNRLDSPTSGLVLLCTDFATRQVIHALFRMHQVRKTYHALVKGWFPDKPQLWQDYLTVQKRNGQIRVQTAPHGSLLAKTHLQVLRSFQYQRTTLSFVQLKPLTGRTHQLRVQCASRTFPILGDETYGDFAWNRRLKAKRLYLHASAIQFTINDKLFEAHCEPDFAPFLTV